jgi:hypothetical protein
MRNGRLSTKSTGRRFPGPAKAGAGPKTEAAKAAAIKAAEAEAADADSAELTEGTDPTVNTSLS